MKFGVFDYNEGGDAILARSYQDRIHLIQALEANGFYSYHLSEHHATPLSMTPSPFIFLAAAARETSRIRLGTLLTLLPLYHPLRLYEEICMLDHLSNGRLDLGLGKGISPHEFDAFGDDISDADEAFGHCFDILHQGFTCDRINHSSTRYSLRDVPVVMKPLQNPYPPLWYGLRGEFGPVFAAQHGMHGVSLGPDARVKELTDAFRKQWDAQTAERRAFGSKIEQPIVGVMRAMFVADTDVEAELVARRAHEVWFQNLAWLWKVRGAEVPISISADFDQARAAGALVVGNPDSVRRVLEAQARFIGHNYLVLLLAFGSLTHKEQMRSLELFHREVMPSLVGMNESN